MRQQAQGGRHAEVSTAATAASYFRAITTRAMFGNPLAGIAHVLEVEPRITRHGVWCGYFLQTARNHARYVFARFTSRPNRLQASSAIPAASNTCSHARATATGLSLNPRLDSAYRIASTARSRAGGGRAGTRRERVPRAPGPATATRLHATRVSRALARKYSVTPECLDVPDQVGRVRLRQHAPEHGHATPGSLSSIENHRNKLLVAVVPCMGQFVQRHGLDEIRAPDAPRYLGLADPTLTVTAKAVCLVQCRSPSHGC